MSDVDRDEVEISAIAALTTAEVRAGLRQFGLQPIERLPPELSCLRAAEETRPGVTDGLIEKPEETQRAVTVASDGEAAQKNSNGGLVWAAMRLQFQWLRSAWGNPAFTMAMIVSVVALSVVVGFAFDVKAVGARPAEPADEPIFEKVKIINFSPAEENKIREAMRPKFTTRCGEAFNKNGLRSPSDVVNNKGVVIRPTSDLWLYSADSLGLVDDRMRLAYQEEFSTSRAQAVTVPTALYGVRLTTDGRPRIFLDGTAFYGRSFLFARLSLSDILIHEFIHVGGQPPTPGWMGVFQHDLAGFEPYDEIMGACR